MGRNCCRGVVFSAEGASHGSALRAFGIARSSAPLPIRGQDAYLVAHRRRKLWELSATFHCSLIGTCLSTAELRRILIKVHPAHALGTDHALHSLGVGLADRNDTAGKLLHKALDARHAGAISRFARARTEAAVQEIWASAVAAGDIPGPYWALMTHPDTSATLQGEAFAEVHMLSHLVGAANRADIRRLSQLEAENLALSEKVARQQARLQEAVTRRDATIQELRRLLQDRVPPTTAGGTPSTDDALLAQIGEMRRRLDLEAERHAALQRRLAEMRAVLEGERRALADSQVTEAVLRSEIEAIDARLAPDEAGNERVQLDLQGQTLLYVGGRPSQCSHLRQIAEAAGATLLLHDGGIEDTEAQIAGLVSRADVAFFPVDCVSHDAVLTVKRHCRRLGKPYIPLRSTGGTAFIAALHGLAQGPGGAPA